MRCTPLHDCKEQTKRLVRSAGSLLRCVQLPFRSASSAAACSAAARRATSAGFLPAAFRPSWARAARKSLNWKGGGASAARVRAQHQQRTFSSASSAPSAALER